jgi:hypothetical protein
MAAKTPQTQAKRAREIALRERREHKREKKAEAAARRAAAGAGASGASAHRAAAPGLPEGGAFREAPADER